MAPMTLRREGTDCRRGHDPGDQPLLVLQRRDPASAIYSFRLSTCCSKSASCTGSGRSGDASNASSSFLTCGLPRLRKMTAKRRPLSHEQAAPPLLFLHGDDRRSGRGFGVRRVVLLTLGLTGGLTS